MCFGIIRSQVRDWWARQKAGSKFRVRSVDEVLIKYKESIRSHAKAGREENRKDSNYYAGAADMLKWIMKER